MRNGELWPSGFCCERRCRSRRLAGNVAVATTTVVDDDDEVDDVPTFVVLFTLLIIDLFSMLCNQEQNRIDEIYLEGLGEFGGDETGELGGDTATR